MEVAAENSDAVAVVGCGRALIGEEIAIVDPDGRTRLGGDRIGEIWVRGEYRLRLLAQCGGVAGDLRPEIESEAGGLSLRTGDLGFMGADGEVFVTGRIKDLIIVRGVNHYPQDIEATVQAADPRLRPGFGAAFAVVDQSGQERIVIVQEVERATATSSIWTRSSAAFARPWPMGMDCRSRRSFWSDQARFRRRRAAKFSGD